MGFMKTLTFGLGTVGIFGVVGGLFLLMIMAFVAVLPILLAIFLPILLVAIIVIPAILIVAAGVYLVHAIGKQSLKATKTRE